ncbi:hypothetical protein RCH19_001199 [Flavobacterium sp. PL12]
MVVLIFSHEFHELSLIKTTVAIIKANSRKKENSCNYSNYNIRANSCNSCLF